jgi:ankyrin repeat protein
MKKNDLHGASKRGDLEAVKHLLAQKGADINLKDYWSGQTALHAAAVGGHLEIVKFLVESGADKEAKTKSALTPLHFAAIDGHFGIVKFLVESGADKKAKTKGNQTPLQWAQRCRNTSIVDYLKSIINFINFCRVDVYLCSASYCKVRLG